MREFTSTLNLMSGKRLSVLLLLALFCCCAHGLRQGQKVSLPDGRRGVIYELYPRLATVHIEDSCWACYEWVERKDLRRK
jgi:hypothetical protein